jgi:mannose-6-phosphate isomerase-like protein (cupin superfamily)
MRTSIFAIAAILVASTCALAQNPNGEEKPPRRIFMDGKPYRAGVDADIDMYIGTWHNSLPRHTHGSLVERDMLTQGDPMAPTRPGAVLQYVNRFVYATLASKAVTPPTTLDKEQEIVFVLSGQGTISWKKQSAKLYSGVALLIPANLKFTIKNTGDEDLAMYLVNEPIPDGFRPNEEILVVDENAAPIRSTTGHWVHIVKTLFQVEDGLATLERVLTVAQDPYTIGHPHAHDAGVEEAWTAISGTSFAFLGKQLRAQPPGTSYMIPPDGKTPHANINTSDEQVKLFYFARYRDHEVRP